MVMEFCSEGSLDVVLYKRKDTPLSEVLMYKIAADVASGLAYLHALIPPLIHRDMRSPNVFVRTSLLLPIMVAPHSLTSYSS